MANWSLIESTMVMQALMKILTWLVRAPRGRIGRQQHSQSNHFYDRHPHVHPRFIPSRQMSVWEPKDLMLPEVLHIPRHMISRAGRV